MIVDAFILKWPHGRLPLGEIDYENFIKIKMLIEVFPARAGWPSAN